MESVQISKPNNAFLNFLADNICKPKVIEQKEIATIDGDIISRGAMDKALKTGKGLMIGGFFVGSLL